MNNTQQKFSNVSLALNVHVLSDRIHKGAIWSIIFKKNMDCQAEEMFKIQYAS